jgi:hypothetical protein
MRSPFALALFAMLVTFAGAARADESDGAAKTDAARKEAQTLFTQALEKANAGDTRGALGAFRSAYERYPSFRVLYNIGQLCIRLGDHACTARAYEQYLRDGGADVPAARRTEVEGELRTVSRKIASLTITSNVAGAEIWIDEAVVGRTPLPRPVAVNAGGHRILLLHEDKSLERSVKVEGIGESVTVDMPVPRDPVASTVRAPAAATKPAPPAPDRPIPILPWAVTGGFAVATAVSGVLAASSYSSFKDTKETFGITRQELEDSQSSARSLLLVTGVLGGLTVVSAGVASYFTWFAPRSSPSAPRVGLGPRGFVLEGTLP